MIYWDFPTQKLKGFNVNGQKYAVRSSSKGEKFLIDTRGQRRMARLVRADWKAIIISLPSRYAVEHLVQHLNAQHINHITEADEL